MRKPAQVKILLLLIIGLYSTMQGQNVFIKKFGSNDSVQKFVSNTALYQVVQKGKILSSSSENRDQKVNVIVELSSPPSIRANRQSSSALNVSNVERTAFINKVLLTLPKAEITHQFSEVINAISLSASRSELEQIASLPEVKHIEEDKRVTASVTHVATKDGNSPVRSATSRATGKGVRVGIIDTGIDYMHEALGGGLGAGFKVAGGYDFVNNDSDPRDDNGHGTHVAGIIAGSSTLLKGLAPDVTLFSYKVLDASGNGTTSAVLAAIEQAIKDSIDIINLSLGTTGGDPDDILSRAVDRTVEAGIVVVAAAGNESDYETITSPGVAREALTVGAVDSKNSVASFSSKGPSARIYGIKPDIVAPGESIFSAKINGGYVSESGTSMAAPYVTAVAANLREMHPLWSAREIRSGILAATRDLHLPVFSQGEGKLDTSKVSLLQTLITPASISLGFDNSSSPIWTKTNSLLLTNISSHPKTYTLGHLSPHSGLNAQVSPSSVSLNSYEERSIEITFTLDNSLWPDNVALSSGYGGTILVISDSETLRVPYVFFKGTVFQISLNETPLQVVIHDRKEKAYYFTPKSSFLTAVVPPGVYDIITSFSGSAYVVKENVSTRENFELTIKKDQANRMITISPINEAGLLLTPVGENTSYCYAEALIHNSSGISEVVMGGGKVQTASLVQKKYLSSVSSDYSFGYALNVQFGNSKSYTYDVEMDSGITASRSFQFVPSDLKRVDFKYDIDSTTARAFPITWLTFIQQNSIVAVTYYDGTDAPLRYPFIQTGYYTRRTSAQFPIFHFREAYKY